MVSIPECRYSRDYKASNPIVAIKKYLNYHRRFSHIRPTKVTATWRDNKGSHRAEAEVQWYTGKLQNSVLKSEHEGEWWKILKVEKR